MKQKIVILAGPTAVGKTASSVDLAKKFNAEIISADSMQIYKYANIGTAKVTNREADGVKHYLIDIKEPTESFSAGDFCELAKEKIKEISNNGKVPFIVGGTGLYINSLLFPLSVNVSKNEELRREYEKIIESEGKESLWQKLNAIDPSSAKLLHVNQTDRIIRALEIYELTGKPKSEFIKNNESEYDYLLIILDRPREELYERINKRVEFMFQDGLIEEVKELINKYNLTNKNQLMQGIGYKEIQEYINNGITLSEVKDLIKQRTRNYAKRQITWFKRMEKAKFINVENTQTIENEIANFLGDKNE